MSNISSQAKQIDATTWEIPTSYKKGMLVPGRIIATKKLFDQMDTQVFDQIANVAMLPGIQKYSLAMPDCHRGYGVAIGGVAAFDTETGIISPGGIGFDINCGMRLLTTNLTIKEVQPKLKDLVDHIFKTVPAGVGCKGFVKVNHQQFDDVMTDGGKWCVDNGYGWKEDITRCEGKGKIDWADSSKVSDKAKKRGIDQLGTLGSGNHYLEIQVVKKENIHDAALAKKFGITQDGQIVVMIHCLHGSSRVMTEHGAWIKIKDLENISSLKVKTMNFSSHQLEIAPIEKFFKLKPHGKTYRISTATQKDIIATEDHPFL